MMSTKPGTGGATVAPPSTIMSSSSSSSSGGAPVPGAATTATTFPAPSSTSSTWSSLAPTEQQQLLSAQQPGSLPHHHQQSEQHQYQHQQQSHAIPGWTGTSTSMGAGTGAGPHYSLPEIAKQAYGAEAIHHRYSIRVTQGATTIGQVQAAPATLQPASTATSLASTTSTSFKGAPAMDKMGTNTSSSAAFVPPVTTSQPHAYTHGSDLSSSSAALASSSASSAMPAAPITQSLQQEQWKHQQPPVFHPEPAATAAATAAPAITQTMFETRAQAPPLPSSAMPTARLGHGAGLESGAITHPSTTTTTSSSSLAPIAPTAPIAPIAPAALGAASMTQEHGRIAPGAVPVTAYTDSERERQLQSADKGMHLDKHQHTSAAAAEVPSQYYPTQPTATTATSATTTTTTTTGTGTTGLVHHHGGGMFCHNKAAAISTAGMTKEEKKQHKLMLQEERKREKLELKQRKEQEKLRLAEEKRRAKEQRVAHEHAQKTRTAKYNETRDITSQRIATDMIKWDTLHAQSAPVGRYNESTEDVLPFTHENLGLFVAVGRGMNLVDGKEAKADAYVKIQLLGRGMDGKPQVHATHKSEVVKNTANPQWLYHVDDTPHLLGAADSNMEWLKTATLRIEIWDHDTLSRDDLLGWIEWPLPQLDNQIVRGDFQLNPPSTATINSSLSTSRDYSSARKSKLTQPGTIFAEIRYRSPFAFAGMRRGSATEQQQPITTAPHLQSGASIAPSGAIFSSGSGGALPHRSSSGEMLKGRSLENRDNIYDLNHTSRSTIQPTAGMVMEPLNLGGAYQTAPLPLPTYAAAPAASMAPAASGLTLGQQPGAQRTSSLLELSAAQHAVPMPAMVHSFPSHGSPKFFFKEKEAKETQQSYTHPATIHTATTTAPAPAPLLPGDMKPDARGASFNKAMVDANVQPTRRSSDIGSGVGLSDASGMSGISGMSGSDSFGSESFYTKPSAPTEMLQQQPLTQQLMATSDSAYLAKQQHHLPTSAATLAPQQYQHQPAAKSGELYAATQQPLAEPSRRSF